MGLPCRANSGSPATVFTANGPKVHIVPDQGPAPPVAFLAFAQLQKSQASHLLSKKKGQVRIYWGDCFQESTCLNQPHKVSQHTVEI